MTLGHLVEKRPRLFRRELGAETEDRDLLAGEEVVGVAGVAGDPDGAAGLRGGEAAEQHGGGLRLGAGVLVRYR